MNYMTDGIDQLIRDTDKAFHTVGSALENAKTATQEWHETLDSSQTLRAVAKPLILLPKTSPSPVPLVRHPLARSVNVSKTRRQATIKKRKRKLLGRTLKVPRSPWTTPAQWTLTDVTTNVADVLIGKIFRIEVDEILSPDQMLKIKRETQIALERKVSIDSDRSASTSAGPPTEPLQLESLVDTRQGKQSPGPNDIFLPPTTLKRSTMDTVEYWDILAPHMPENLMLVDDIAFPSPARSIRSRSSSRAVPLLPTIPEFPPLTLPSRTFRSLSMRSELTQDHILLPSTPFTLISPLFRHGPIRVDRRSKIPQDMSMSRSRSHFDWTAYKMAVVGAMDDASSGNEADDELEANEAELDDIISWWESFGFEGSGRLVKDAPKRGRVKTDRKRRTWRALGRIGPIEQATKSYHTDASGLLSPGHSNGETTTMAATI